MLSRLVTSGKVMEPGAVLQMDNFYWKDTLKEVHVKGTLLVDASSRVAVVRIWRTAPRQELLGWKCVSVGSETKCYKSRGSSFTDVQKQS